MSRGGGVNAENSQVSDGRRVPLRKCRDCDNAVRSDRSHLCSDCNSVIFEKRREISRKRALAAYNKSKSPKIAYANELSRGLAGLQQFWLRTSFNVAEPIP